VMCVVDGLGFLFAPREVLTQEKEPVDILLDGEVLETRWWDESDECWQIVGRRTNERSHMLCMCRRNGARGRTRVSNDCRHLLKSSERLCIPLV
jgi:hypothetical protein